MRILFTSLLLFALPSFAFADTNCDEEYARYEDLECAKKMLDFADKQLNSAYDAVSAKIGPDSKEKLKEAHRAWIQFRDADTALAYRNSGKVGSLGELIATNHKIDLTIERTNQLLEFTYNPVEPLRESWDCRVGPKSLSTAATRLRTSEAISLAMSAAKKQGWHLDNYRPSSICFDASKHQWTVFFEGRVLLPGIHFLVWVEDSTGATKIMPGE